MKREFSSFGTGNLDLDQIDLAIDDSVKLARHFGERNGCPVVTRLIEVRGAESLVPRYAQVNFWYKYALEQLDKSEKVTIANEFRTPIPRLPDEPQGKHDPDCIPNSHELQMIGLGSPIGFALPRMLLEFIGSDENLIKRERLDTALIALDTSIKDPTSVDATTFVVNLAEKLRDACGEGGYLLKHLLSTGKLSEDNCRSAYYKIIEIMRTNAPNLWNDYLTMSKEDMNRLHVADVKINNTV